MSDVDRDLLIELMSLLFNRDDLYVSSSIQGHIVGFGGKLARIIPNRAEPFILVVTDYGMQFGVSFTDLKIEGPSADALAGPVPLDTFRVTEIADGKVPQHQDPWRDASPSKMSDAWYSKPDIS